MTNSEKLSFILEKEMEITMAVTQGGHRATDRDKFSEDRKKIKQYRIDLLLHESTHDKEIREAILVVQRYKTTYLDKKL